MGLLFLMNCTYNLDNNIESYKLGTEFSIDIIKRASQIWFTEANETIILFNFTGQEDNINNHLLLFDNKLKLIGEIEFNTQRIEKISKDTIISYYYKQTESSYFQQEESKKKKIGKYCIKYVPYDMCGAARLTKRLLDDIEIDSNLMLTFKYRVKENNEYYHIDNIEEANKVLTHKEQLNIHLNYLEIDPYEKIFAEFSNENYINGYDYMVPINSNVYNGFYIKIFDIIKKRSNTH